VNRLAAPFAIARPRPAAAGGEEAGFTLLEVMIATLAMSVVVTSVGGVMLTMQRTGVGAIRSENAAGTARTGLLELQRDLQAANPLVDWTSTVSAYEDELQLELGPTGGTQQRITWSYVSGSGPSCRGTLYRSVGSGGPVPEVTGVTNCQTGLPVFSYFGQQGENLLANPASVTAAILSECSVRVAGTVRVSAGANTTPFTETASMRLVNWQPGTQPCP
jgi:prepilin-type N-terminal cleavage/methylation domain-containing protein